MRAPSAKTSVGVTVTLSRVLNFSSSAVGVGHFEEAVGVTPFSIHSSHALRRSGEHQIVGMAECFRIAGEEMAAEVPRVRRLRDKLVAALGAFPEVRFNGSLERRIAHNLNVSVNLPNCDGLVSALTDIAVSSTSACSSGAASPSHVLAALGSPAGSALRITVGRFNTEAEVDYAIGYLYGKIEACRKGAPLAQPA